MLKKLVHKICINKDCEKFNVPQEPGLYLCEVCQGELQPVYVWNKQALAAIALVGGAAVMLAGIFGFEYTANRLAPMEAMRVLSGLDHLVKMDTSGRSIGGKTVLANGTVTYVTTRDFGERPFIERKEGDAIIFRHRHEYANGEEFRWELNTNLKHVYFFVDRATAAKLLTKGSGDGGTTISAKAPAGQDEFYKMDSTPGTEKFVVVYSDKTLGDFDGADTIDASKFSGIVRRLEKDPDVVVYHVELPHVSA